MNVQELKQRFEQKRAFATEDLNELLVFAKKAYLYNELSAYEYKKIVEELESAYGTEHIKN
ncbi:YppF family protein [Falsibacillus pallidus]